MAAKTYLKSALTISVLFVVLAFAGTAQAKIIYVDNDGPADFYSIQAAIDDSNDGDVVIVAEGRYVENINFNGKNITLRSTDPNDPDVVAATIIDGYQNGSVVTFDNGEDDNCVLSGFTITNGNAQFGGGIYCSLTPYGPPHGPPPVPDHISPGPTITNCVISDNSAFIAGGGMFNNYAISPTLTNCTFNRNSARNFGGGM